MIAIVLSLLVNVLLLGLLGLYFQHADWRIETQLRPKPDPSAVSTIYIDPVAATAEEMAELKPQAQRKPFARTSPDQPESTEKTGERIGERNTRATSENPADPNAEALPSQSGIEPRENEIETTESQYQDGKLIPATPSNPAIAALTSLPSAAPDSTPHQPITDATPREPSAAVPLDTPIATTDNNPESLPAETEQLDPTMSEESSLPPPRESLLDGPNPVEVNVPKEVDDSDRPKETPQRAVDRPTTDSTDPATQRAVHHPPRPATTPREKAFKGYQRKTAMVGSISRTGRSALNVDDTEMGRYQAAISKAVELEWQRNCMRHRDFITPGFLTVRFYVEPSGRVRSVNFLGEMESGEVQKGFTLSSIREADIPKMPKGLAEAYEDDTLELVFRFYF